MGYFILCLLVSIFGSIRFNVGGAISPGEILLLGYGMFHLSAVLESLRRREIRRLLYLCLAYLAAQVFTDFIRGTEAVDCLRGWARIGMMSVSFLILSVMIGTHTTRMLAFVIGATLANAFSALLIGADYARDPDAFYKFIVGAPITMAAFIFSGYAPRQFGYLRIIAPFFAGPVAFLAGARSMAGVALAAAASRWIFNRSPKQMGRIDMRSILGVCALAVVAVSIFEFYSYAAPAGLLGERARARFEWQKGSTLGKRFSLLDGRSELQYSFPKIMQSPIIGYGSWIKDPLYVFNRAVELGVNPETAHYQVATSKGLIPSHSHLFGAWLEAGIMGAIFWAVVALRSGLVLLRGQLSAMGKFTPVAYVIFVSFFWEVLFSPFGGEKRIWNGFLLWLIVVIPFIATRAKASAVQPRPVHV